jgi:hypothetical protein
MGPKLHKPMPMKRNDQQLRLRRGLDDKIQNTARTTGTMVWFGLSRLHHLPLFRGSPGRLNSSENLQSP